MDVTGAPARRSLSLHSLWSPFGAGDPSTVITGAEPKAIGPAWPSGRRGEAIGVTGHATLWGSVFLHSANDAASHKCQTLCLGPGETGR